MERRDALARLPQVVRSDVRFPIGLLTFAFFLTFAAFGWFGWVTVASGRQERLHIGRLVRVEQLYGVIVHLDEVLTMSARMAAETGDSRWEERYRQFEPQLVAAIKETIRLGEDAAGIHSATRTDQANARLVEMENRAFSLILTGRAPEARAVLNSPDYRIQQALYTEGIASFVNQTRIEIAGSFRRAKRVDLLSVITALIVGGVSFLAWLSTVRGIQRWRAALEGSINDHAQTKRQLSRDVTTARARALEMAHSAEHDFLTGLPNRVLLNDRIGQAIALAPRHRQQVAVLFLDLDGFKQINDSLGHSIGDRLLQSVAKRLVDSVRGSDTVSRQGGDEFVVLLSEAGQKKNAALIAKKIVRAVGKTHSIGQHNLRVTSSIGVSVYPDDGLDAETLIKNADTAMYKAKESGGRTYRFFAPGMNVRTVEQPLDESLRHALDWKEFARTFTTRGPIDAMGAIAARSGANPGSAPGSPTVKVT